MKKTIKVGMIGYRFMGKAHSNAYSRVGMFFDPPLLPVKKVICGRTETQLKEAARLFGWEEYETKWEKVVRRKDIELVDINTPNSTHKPIAIEAAKKGKHILCEKPLSMNLKEAKEMLEAVKKAGIVHMVCFNYRRVPALCLAKKLIEEGKIGKIYHFRAQYLQDWLVDPDFPLVWRLRKEVAGSGVHGDLNSHLIDLARWLVGEFEEVVGLRETFIKKRPLPVEGKKEMGEVTVDDSTLFLARFKNGALGSFEATRFAPGRKNGQRIEINGSKGSLLFELEDLNSLWFYSLEDPPELQGFRKIQVTGEVFPYARNWWPPGHIIGYEHTFVHIVADLLEGIKKGESPSPNFEDGVKCQEVLEAVERSIEKKEWVKLGE